MILNSEEYSLCFLNCQIYPFLSISLQVRTRAFYTTVLGRFQQTARLAATLLCLLRIRMASPLAPPSTL